ncbi:MAG TPA: L-threonylcarbamoyladenylate synthase [Anaeromyxobacter sp.]|nr:L-threonylcarbamoyladenylate synthase [Anaeromyxobacter sp.]
MDPAMQARVDSVAEVLRRGGVVAYPTETFYGLGALVRDAAAVRRLAGLKGRPDGKPLPLVAGDRAQVDAVALLDSAADRLAAAFWPGPLTLVVPARAGLPPELGAGTGTIGVRISGSEIARALALAAGAALVSTSANPAGAPPPARPEDLDPALRARLDAVLDGGPAPGGAPSTVVEVNAGVARLVRQGVVPFEEVLAALRREGR